MKKALFQSLRQQFPTFYYQSYKWDIIDNKLIVSFNYSFSPQLTFTTQYEINNFQLINHSFPVIDNLVFHCGLVEGLSYWKLACSPKYQLNCGSINTSQIDWWHQLVISSMGEYFYQNCIDFTPDNFFTISINHQSPLETGTVTLNPNNLILVGGGKDSAVTLSSLSSLSLTALVVNPHPAIHKTLAISNIPAITLARILDPHLYDLNKTGFLNGHTPFSAMLAFVSVLVAYCQNYPNIILSNENSSNEANLVYLGHPINHQYSKSFAFETKFHDYVNSYLVKDLNYFSFLRPLNELQIAEKFSRLTKYYQAVSSCNQNQHIGTWCCRCPKCIGTYLILSPFMSIQDINTIFPSNPLTNTANWEILVNLLTYNAVKPFECVPTHQEIQVAVKNLIHTYRKHHLPLPILLTKAESKLMPHLPSINTLLSTKDTKHLVPDSFIPFL